jgi:hypothetical protein
MSDGFQRPLGYNTFTNKNGALRVGDRQVGYIKYIDRLMFITHRKRALHYFRNIRGYGMNKEILQYLCEHKIDTIVIIEDKVTMLESNVNLWLRFGLEVTYNPHEPQLVLSEEHMKKIGVGEVKEVET